MSNIYIQEPPTHGKVLLKTSVGDIDVELWSKEAPKACRNFVQLCMEGYYDNTIFHRVVPEFIVQGGDPTGTGEGGDSIYGKPFRDEFHSRLRFVRRGLVAMANAGRDDNGSQFFFTLGPTQELQNKHTIFGKVGGNTIYNMLKLSDADTNREDRPRYPQKILKTKVLANPFENIVPRTLPKREKVRESKEPKSKGTKNFKLLSFGEEAEEDEEETNIVTEKIQKIKGKSKSSHDLLDDDKLSSMPAVDDADDKGVKRKLKSNEEEEDEAKAIEEKEAVRKKLRKQSNSPNQIINDEKDIEEMKESAYKQTSPYKEDLVERDSEKAKRLEALKKEQKMLRKELRDKPQKKAKKEEETESTKDEPEEIDTSDPIAMFKAEAKKYSKNKKSKPDKGDRQAETLAMLEKFKTKIGTAQKMAEYDSDEDTNKVSRESEEEEDDSNDMGWLSHKLHFEESKKKVLDANVDDAERYDIFDPRNPMTKRRREESKKIMKKKR